MRFSLRLRFAIFFGVFGVLVLATTAFSAEATDDRPEGSKPNVIIVLTDDQGYGDLSCHGNPILKTPNLDALQSESVRFTDFHVAPMCTPTRGQLLTGRDAMDNGATFVNRRSFMRRELPTMADVFKANGYRTGLFGKWHLGDSYPHCPINRGFDTVIRHGSWGISSIADYFGNDYFDDTYKHNGKYEKYEGYCTDVWFTEAMKWMKECKEKKEPFFCYVPTNVPHGPHWVNEEYAKPYKKKGVPDKFFGMIANLDENMGRLMKFLDENGMADNTILIFMTDNGTASGEKVFNAGMRGMKMSYYEGGHRVPCFVRWPSGKLGDAREIDVLTHVQDILPTLTEFCDLKSPVSTDYDGVSLVPLLQGKAKELADPDRMLVVQYREKPKKYLAAVLWKKWRLIGGKELYRVDTDPGQKKDIAADHPDVVQKMRAHYDKWWDEVQPAFKQKKWIDLGSEEANPMTLYASDWQGDYADNWWNIRKGNAVGQWNVRVTRPGQYAVTLYRWAPETKAALDAPLEGPNRGKGLAVPIRKARLKIAGIDKKKPTEKGAKSVTFNVELPAGDHVLRTRFFDENDKPLCSAYYVEVERVE